MQTVNPAVRNFQEKDQEEKHGVLGLGREVLAGWRQEGADSPAKVCKKHQFYP